jgi:hypothetical protein
MIDIPHPYQPINLQMKMVILLFGCILCLACRGQHKNDTNTKTLISTKLELVDPKGQIIKNRFHPPINFIRNQEEEGSFAGYLRNLALKPVNAMVRYYDGNLKNIDGIYVSVVDMDIDEQDLQQCADAVMRLRGEYLYQKGSYDEIHFNFFSDGEPRYYKEYAKGDYSYKRFRKYMRYIFAYANTSSLHDELESIVDITHMQIGDVFIQKGSPYGHAVIVVDMVHNPTNNKRLYLLAQSYMPAQETQILVNPMNIDINPWYELDTNTIYTPEWTFNPGDLRRFKD